MTSNGAKITAQMALGFLAGVGSVSLITACGPTPDGSAAGDPVPYVSSGFSADEADYLNALRERVSPAIVNGSERERIQAGKRMCSVAQAGPHHAGAAVDDSVVAQTVALFDLDALTTDIGRQRELAGTVIDIVSDSKFCR